MKRTILLSISVIVCLAACSPSRVVVKEKPPAPVVLVRPAPPYPTAVWVGDEWRWRHGRYIYVRGHYVKPRRGHIWMDGHWKTTPRGLVWVSGHWR